MNLVLKNILDGSTIELNGVQEKDVGDTLIQQESEGYRLCRNLYTEEENKKLFALKCEAVQDILSRLIGDIYEK
jgi:hypothetical protein